MQTAGGDHLLIESGSGSRGLERVKLNGRAVQQSEACSTAELSVTLSDPHHLSVTVGVFTLEVDNSDAFVNIANARVSNWTALTRTLRSHGLLGQSWRRQSHSQQQWHIEGQADDYAVGDSDLWGLVSPFTRFTPRSSPYKSGAYRVACNADQ